MLYIKHINVCSMQYAVWKNKWQTVYIYCDKWTEVILFVGMVLIWAFVPSFGLYATLVKGTVSREMHDCSRIWDAAVGIKHNPINRVLFLTKLSKCSVFLLSKWCNRVTWFSLILGEIAFGMSKTYLHSTVNYGESLVRLGRTAIDFIRYFKSVQYFLSLFLISFMGSHRIC